MVQLTVGSTEDPYNNVSLIRSDDIVRDGKRDSLGCMVLANSMVLSGTGDDIHSVMLAVVGVGTMEESIVESIKESVIMTVDDISGTIVDNINDSAIMTVEISGAIVDCIKDSDIIEAGSNVDVIFGSNVDNK